NVIAVGENTIKESPSQLAQFFFTFGVPEKILAVFADRHVGVHAAAVYAHYWLGQKAGGESHFRRYLAAAELVELDLVGGGDDFAVAVVDFKLCRLDFPMGFLVLVARGAPHFVPG